MLRKVFLIANNSSMKKIYYSSLFCLNMAHSVISLTK